MSYELNLYHPGYYCTNADGTTPQTGDGKERTCFNGTEGAPEVDQSGAPVGDDLTTFEYGDGSTVTVDASGNVVEMGAGAGSDTDNSGNPTNTLDGTPSDDPDNTGGTGSGAESNGNGDGNGDGSGNSDGNGNGGSDDTNNLGGNDGNQGGMPNPDDNGGNGPSGMPSDDDSGSGPGHHPNSDDGMPDPDGNGPSGPNSNVGFGTLLNAGATVLESAQSHGSEAGSHLSVINGGSFWDQAAHAAGQSLGALAGHLSIGAFTPAESTSAHGASSLASLQHDTGFQAELHADELAHAGSDAAALGHVDGTAGSISTVHLEVGSLHSGIEDAAHHSAFSTQLHL